MRSCHIYRRLCMRQTAMGMASTLTQKWRVVKARGLSRNESLIELAFECPCVCKEQLHAQSSCERSFVHRRMFRAIAHLWGRTTLSQIPLRYLVRSWSQTGSKLVVDKLRTSVQPASVMEFGF